MRPKPKKPRVITKDYKTVQRNMGIKASTKRIGETIKQDAAMQRLNNKNAKIAAKNEQLRLKRENRALKAQNRREGNWFQRKIQQNIDLSNAKNDAKVRIQNAKATEKELNPELRMLEAKTESEVKKSKAAAAAKATGYMAVAKGASDLGRGLMDEQNRDDAKQYNALSDNLDKIFGEWKGDSSDDTGSELSTGEV